MSVDEIMSLWKGIENNRQYMRCARISLRTFMPKTFSVDRIETFSPIGSPYGLTAEKMDVFFCDSKNN